MRKAQIMTGQPKARSTNGSMITDRKRKKRNATEQEIVESILQALEKNGQPTRSPEQRRQDANNLISAMNCKERQASMQEALKTSLKAQEKIEQALRSPEQHRRDMEMMSRAY
jgi:hypothetical protein